jgi:hypothetical protein
MARIHLKFANTMSEIDIEGECANDIKALFLEAWKKLCETGDVEMMKEINAYQIREEKKREGK